MGNCDFFPVCPKVNATLQSAKALFKARCSGVPKVATGALTKIDGNTVYLKVSKIADPKTRASDKKKTDASKAKKDL